MNSASDNVAARITSPQRVVDYLKTTAITAPLNNQIFTIRAMEFIDPWHHGTAYERALILQADFPGSKIDLKDFPKPVTSVGVEDTVNPMPVTQSEMPTKLNLPNEHPHPNAQLFDAGGSRNRGSLNTLLVAEANGTHELLDVKMQQNLKSTPSEALVLPEKNSHARASKTFSHTP